MKPLKDRFPLRVYMNGLTLEQQEAFARACGTSVGYLRKFICRRPKIDVDVAARISAASRFRVSIESLRPDVDWPLVRKAINRSTPQRPDGDQPGECRAP